MVIIVGDNTNGVFIREGDSDVLYLGGTQFSPACETLGGGVNCSLRALLKHPHEKMVQTNDG